MIIVTFTPLVLMKMLVSAVLVTQDGKEMVSHARISMSVPILQTIAPVMPSALITPEGFRVPVIPVMKAQESAAPILTSVKPVIMSAMIMPLVLTTMGDMIAPAIVVLRDPD